jgi:hypothetical protein
MRLCGAVFIGTDAATGRLGKVRHPGLCASRKDEEPGCSVICEWSKMIFPVTGVSGRKGKQDLVQSGLIHAVREHWTRDAAVAPVITRIQCSLPPPGALREGKECSDSWRPWRCPQAWSPV